MQSQHTAISKFTTQLFFLFLNKHFSNLFPARQFGQSRKFCQQNVAIFGLQTLLKKINLSASTDFETIQRKMRPSCEVKCVRMAENAGETEPKRSKSMQQFVVVYKEQYLLEFCSIENFAECGDRIAQIGTP